MANIHQAAEEHIYLRAALETLRKQTHAMLEDGRNIQAHYRRLEKEYSDWQDRLYNIDQEIEKLAGQVGLTPREIQSEIAVPQLGTSILDDLFGDTKEAVKDTPFESVFDPFA